MAHKRDKLSALRGLYVFERQSLKACAERIGVSEGTARRWKKAALGQGDCWDKARAAASMSGQAHEDVISALLNDFVILHQSLVADVKKADDMDAAARVTALSALADAFSKFMASAGKASPKINRLSFAMEIIQLLGAFIIENHPDKASVFAEVIEPFGQEVSKRYG